MQNSEQKDPLLDTILASPLVRILSTVIFISFVALTIAAIWEHGVIAIFTYQFATLGGTQVFLDLVIMALLFSMIQFDHARRNKRSFLPWFIGTLIVGSLSPLLYIITNKRKS